MSTSWIASQILGMSPIAHRDPVVERTQFGNRVVGQPSPGSSTDLVLSWLEGRRPGAWWAKYQICAATHVTPKACDWALLFLRSTGRVEASQDDGRSSRYLRYRAITKNHHHKARSAE